MKRRIRSIIKPIHFVVGLLCCLILISVFLVKHLVTPPLAYAPDGGTPFDIQSFPNSSKSIALEECFCEAEFDLTHNMLVLLRGRNQRPLLISDFIWTASLSRAGKYILAQPFDGRSLLIIDADSYKTISKINHYVYSFGWARNDDVFWYSDNSGNHIFNLATGKTDNRLPNGEALIWSKDYRYFVAAENRGKHKYSNLVLYDDKTKSSRKIGISQDGLIKEAAFSHNNDAIFYSITGWYEVGGEGGPIGKTGNSDELRKVTIASNTDTLIWARKVSPDDRNWDGMAPRIIELKPSADGKSISFLFTGSKDPIILPLK